MPRATRRPRRRRRRGGRLLAGRLLTGRLLLVGRRALRRLLRGALVLTALLAAALLLVMRFALLAELVLLVAREDAHDLAAELLTGTRIARATLGMGLRILLDQGLNVLLLIAGEVQASEPLRPAMLELRLAGHRAAALRLSGILRLLSAYAQRQCERHGESGRGYEVLLHSYDTSPPAGALPERPIRTEQAV